MRRTILAPSSAIAGSRGIATSVPTNSATVTVRPARWVAMVPTRPSESFRSRKNPGRPVDNETPRIRRRDAVGRRSAHAADRSRAGPRRRRPSTGAGPRRDPARERALRAGDRRLPLQGGRPSSRDRQRRRFRPLIRTRQRGNINPEQWSALFRYISDVYHPSSIDGDRSGVALCQFNTSPRRLRGRSDNTDSAPRSRRFRSPCEPRPVRRGHRPHRPCRLPRASPRRSHEVS